MKEYFVVQGEPATPNNAIRTFDTPEEALSHRDELRAEILQGIYDSEWDIESDSDRQALAEDVEAYGVEYSSARAIRKIWKL